MNQLMNIFKNRNNLIVLFFIILFSVCALECSYVKQIDIENRGSVKPRNNMGEVLENNLAQNIKEKHEVNEIIPKKNEQLNVPSDSKILNEREKNPYFFNVDRVEYHGYFRPLSGNVVCQDVYLNINEVKVFDDGTLYTLEIDQIQVENPEDEITRGRRYLGYFFVTSEDIFCMPTGFDGYTDEKTQEAIRLIEESGTLFSEHFTLVCNESGTENVTDENGWHEYIVVDGDTRSFRFYNDYMGGTKTYKRIMWEKGKGIIFYRHGEGSQLMNVELWQGNVIVKRSD